MKKYIYVIPVALLFFILGFAGSRPAADRVVRITADEQVILQTGKAQIVMNKDGSIVIKGSDIRIESTGAVQVKASGNITMKGKKILEN